MKREQLSHRIGNIEDRLVEQAENAPNFGQVRRNRSVRRMVSIAAVLVLMVASFAMGAIALAKETVVYIEKEQEIVTVGDSGISLILPDTWKDKYGYEQDGNYLAVFHLATRETFELGGVFFWIEYIPARYPMDYVYPEPGFTIAVTETGTYRMTYTSDVQVDISNPEAWAEYDEMAALINSIEIVMTAEMLANTTNASNWVQGTAYVEFIDAQSQELIKTVDYNAEQSQIIQDIVETQDYQLPFVSFRYDLWIMVNGREYRMNSITGNIGTTIDGDGGYCAVLSAEDLSRIMDILSD